MALIRAGNQADLTFQVDGGPADKLRVKSFHGSEHVSRLFQFTVELVSLDEKVSFDSVLEKPVVLKIAGTEGKRVVHGIVSRFEQVGKGARFTTYHAEIVPSIWLLSLRSRCRIFQNMSTKDIVAKVLKGAGIKDDGFKLALKGSYPVREYCVQYRESDLDFISRLLEEDGIFYYFEHSNDGDVLIMLDSTETTKPLPDKANFPFNPSKGLTEEKEHIYEFRLAQSVRSGAARLKDYNYLKPATSLEANKQGERGVDFEVYDYPGLYLEPEDGKRLAATRHEELQSARTLAKGSTTTRRLIPGFRFKLEEHPRSDFNNKEYVLVGVYSGGSQPQSEEEDSALGSEGVQFSSTFECIPASDAYRPSRITPKPTVDGIQTAKVVGPKGEKLYMDEHGRAKVMFHWDLEGKGDENCTCWVRVASLYAGNDHGVQFHPLIGDEVIIDFLEGDLDRPIVTGRLYNGTNKPPLKPDNRIQNTILTPYQHRLHFDDKKASITLNTGGSETLYLGDAKEDKDFGNNVKISTKDGHFIQLAKGNTHKGFMLQTEKKHKAEIRDDPSPGIFLQDESGKLLLHIDIEHKTINLINDEQKEILLKCAGGNVTVKAAEITLDAENKVTIKAGTEIDLSAPTVKTEGQQKVEISGMQVKVEGQTQLELSGMTAKFEGKTMGEVKGGAMLNISGGLVKIN